MQFNLVKFIKTKFFLPNIAKPKDLDVTVFAENVLMLRKISFFAFICTKRYQISSFKEFSGDFKYSDFYPTKGIDLTVSENDGGSCIEYFCYILSFV